MNRFLVIAIGAALGANARYLVGLWAADRFGAGFPYGTLIVNVTGSLLLGFVLTLVTERLTLSPDARLLLTVGFLGSYTTFSSYAVESASLLRDSGIWAGMVNIVGNNLVALMSAVTFALNRRAARERARRWLNSCTGTFPRSIQRQRWKRSSRCWKRAVTGA